MIAVGSYLWKLAPPPGSEAALLQSDGFRRFAILGETGPCKHRHTEAYPGSSENNVRFRDAWNM